MKGATLLLGLESKMWLMALVRTNEFHDAGHAGFVAAILNCLTLLLSRMIENVTPTSLNS